MPGQTECGDQHVILATKDGMLAAVVDGLGHGNEAAAASRSAVEILKAHAEEHVISLLNLCHEGLRQSRGAAMSIASFGTRDGVMTWLGVGNVEGLLVRAEANAPSEELLLRGGLVGSQLPPLQAAVLPVVPGDLLVLVTDGVQNDFHNDLLRADSPQRTADRILSRHGKGTDDALVLVVRYLGWSR